MADLAIKVTKVTTDIKTAATAPVCDGMRSVYVRCFSSPLGEWRRACHVLDHCRAIHAVLTAYVTPILPEAAVRPELLPIYDPRSPTAWPRTGRHPLR